MDLSDLKNALRVNTTKKIKVKYLHRQETNKFINDYFKQQRIKAHCVDFAVTRKNNHPIYANTFELKVPKSVDCTQVIEDISLNSNIMQIKRVHA